MNTELLEKAANQMRNTLSRNTKDETIQILKHRGLTAKPAQAKAEMIEMVVKDALLKFRDDPDLKADVLGSLKYELDWAIEGAQKKIASAREKITAGESFSSLLGWGALSEAAAAEKILATLAPITDAFALYKEDKIALDDVEQQCAALKDDLTTKFVERFRYNGDPFNGSINRRVAEQADACGQADAVTTITNTLQVIKHSRERIARYTEQHAVAVKLAEELAAQANQQ